MSNLPTTPENANTLMDEGYLSLSAIRFAKAAENAGLLARSQLDESGQLRNDSLFCRSPFRDALVDLTTDDGRSVEEKITAMLMASRPNAVLPLALIRDAESKRSLDKKVFTDFVIAFEIADDAAVSASVTASVAAEARANLSGTATHPRGVFDVLDEKTGADKLGWKR